MYLNETSVTSFKLAFTILPSSSLDETQLFYSILALLRLGAPILSLSIYHSLSLSLCSSETIPSLSLSPADNKHAYNTARSESFSDPTRMFWHTALTAWPACSFGA